ncbi:hypothetical protein PUNSTDRAFT_35946, partial [Punctularia strigosozonata HHB-11173 SS5]|uniref:uncharacterized protein n=1 Tax=Punctularia strigosozonata (strain HHB-11173) TaxID=741275 RepID=UPI0004417722
KKVICMSIMAQATNQRCNTLQTMVGVFLHSCSTPEAAIELLQRFGISNSSDAINDAVASLAKDSLRQIQQLGESL